MIRKYSALFLSLTAILSLNACRLSANFFEVDKDKLYRSAQLTGEEFETAVTKLGIKTVINLRGAAPGKDWFDAEKAVFDKHDVELINIGMSAKRLPHKEDLRALLTAFQTAERPILIHCKAGADRTGEASAIYMMEFMGASRKKALKMLSPKYYHFPAFMPAKKYFVKAYQGMEWGLKEYDPCTLNYKYYDRNKHCGTTEPRPSMHSDAVDDDT